MAWSDQLAPVGAAVDEDGAAAPTWVKTRPEDVTVMAKAVTARVPAAMAIVKTCFIEEAPFRRARCELAHWTLIDQP
jgi:hypothetical protein